MAGLRGERLEAFVAWATKNITGDEKGQAQIFLDRLFQGFGQPGCLDVGGTPEFRIRKSQEDGGGTAFADYVWKPVVLIEMKKRGEDLSRHFRQAFDYWTRLVPGRPRYVILCNFDEFWIYDFESQIDSPVDTVKIEELSTRYGPLAFLFPTPERPVFGNDHEAVTRDAADLLARCFHKLARRKDVDRETARRFILQMLVALFAEDIGLMDRYLVIQLLEECKSPRDSYDLLGGLFTAMNTKGGMKGGRFKGVDYFNGGLFIEPARIELQEDELNQLKQAAKSDWSKVQPEIFGTIFQHSMEEKERHAFGAHFTSPVDIMKIVGPTIVDPWRKLIEGAKTSKRLAELRMRLENLHVLDPACGSGNFLYIAYREMKRLEARIFERMKELSSRGNPAQRQISFVTAAQFHGIDINPFAVELAKVTMMIARKLAIDELHISEKPLPLDNLDGNFHAMDALIDDEGKPAKWPKADVIIGNPPFLDARKMTIEHGDKYVAKLERAYPMVARRCDLCVYWFRKAHDHLPECATGDPVAGRAGLVGTQNVRNNEAREAGLGHITSSGTIVEAVDNQPWSGEANVHVSIANWVKRLPANSRLTKRERATLENQLLIPDSRRLWFKSPTETGAKKRRKRGDLPASKTYDLSFRDCDHISSSLSDQTDLAGAKVLSVNREPKRCFEGQQPGHKGFRIDKQEYQKLPRDERKVVFPYLNATGLLTDGLKRKPEFLIDFGKRDIYEAAAFTKAFAAIRDRVLSKWQNNAAAEQVRTGRDTGEHQRRLGQWWQLKRRRGELLRTISKAKRYVVCSRVTKRPVFAFLCTTVRPDSSLTAFAFPDDYSFGILQSDTHWQWFVAKCSKLKSDFRYTPESVFDTFPWPQSPSANHVTAVAKAGRELRRIRAEALGNIKKGGLRAVYRQLEMPGKNPLKDAHAALDAAVLEAYGFSARKDLLAQLLELNLAVAAQIEAGETVVAPGIPPGYPDPSRLITDDCISPAHE